MPNIYQKTDDVKVKEAEIRLSAYIMEHNIPFNSVDHLSKLFPVMFPDSKIAINFTCSRSKCTALVNNVTGKFCFETIVGLLKENKFSLIVDESTDHTSIKHLALVVKIFDPSIETIVDTFLDLIPVPTATADSMYNIIKQFFLENSIPYTQKMIGFAADGANVMMGSHHSLSSLLQKDIPNLFIMKCTCHSFHLCASYACEKLPRVVEDIARDVYSFFKHSYKRQSEFREFQEFLQLKPHKLLHP